MMLRGRRKSPPLDIIRIRHGVVRFNALEAPCCQHREVLRLLFDNSCSNATVGLAWAEELDLERSPPTLMCDQNLNNLVSFHKAYLFTVDAPHSIFDSNVVFRTRRSVHISDESLFHHQTQLGFCEDHINETLILRVLVRGNVFVVVLQTTVHTGGNAAETEEKGKASNTAHRCNRESHILRVYVHCIEVGHYFRTVGAICGA